MNKIYILCGRSSSGKDSLLKKVIEKTNLKFVVSHTSRPMRKNESQGDPYYFVTDKEFSLIINKMIECRAYSTLVDGVPDIWHYGVHKTEIDLNKHSYGVILDIEGIKSFKKYFGEDKIKVLYIEVDEKNRINRAKKRGSFNYQEWERRLLSDEKDFSNENIVLNCDHMVTNYDFDMALDYILEIIKNAQGEKMMRKNAGYRIKNGMGKNCYDQPNSKIDQLKNMIENDIEDYNNLISSRYLSERDIDELAGKIKNAKLNLTYIEKLVKH